MNILWEGCIRKSQNAPMGSVPRQLPLMRTYACDAATFSPSGLLHCLHRDVSSRMEARSLHMRSLIGLMTMQSPKPKAARIAIEPCI